jgi:hypothetical protein
MEILDSARTRQVSHGSDPRSAASYDGGSGVMSSRIETDRFGCNRGPACPMPLEDDLTIHLHRRAEVLPVVSHAKPTTYNDAGTLWRLWPYRHLRRGGSVIHDKEPDRIDPVRAR